MLRTRGGMMYRTVCSEEEENWTLDTCSNPHDHHVKLCSLRPVLHQRCLHRHQGAERGVRGPGLLRQARVHRPRGGPAGEHLGVPGRGGERGEAARIYQSVICAAQVVLSGFSAGAFGTEANCDLLADSLHAINPDIRVRCIVDSGSIYPLNTHRYLYTIYPLSTHYLHLIYTVSTQC